MHDEAALHLAVVFLPEKIEPVERPVGDPAIARKLGGAEGRDEVPAERRPVRESASVDVERGIAPVRVQFVADRWIDPFGQGLGAAQMRRDEDDSVRARQPRLGEIVRVAGRRVRDGRMFGLRLIKNSDSEPPPDHPTSITLR